MAADFSWIYLLIFIILPLSRIIPRLMAKRRMKNNPNQTIQENNTIRNFGTLQPTKSEFSTPTKKESKPQSKEMMVLGELNRGTKTFEGIQKNTKLDEKELNSILEDLEKKDLIKVHQKQGFFGSKIELYPTDKGFSEYYS